METFRIKQNGFEEIKKALLIKIAVIILIIVFFALILILFNKDKNGNTFLFPFLFFTLILSYFSFKLFRILKKQRIQFESIIISINNSSISKEQINIKQNSIFFDEITSIMKLKNGAFLIQGKTNQDRILIPSQMERIDRIEFLLNEIKPISDYKTTFNYLLIFIPLILKLIGSTIFLFTSSNKIVVLISGIISISILTSMFLYIQFNKSIDKKTKQSMWAMLIVIASFCSILYMKLSGKN